MSKRPTFRLGRGLSSLMSLEVPPEAPESDSIPAEPAVGAPSRLQEIDAPAVQGPRFVQLDIASIRPNPHQPRKHFDEASLNALATSVAESGLIQPIVVRPAGDGYELIAGERRLRAARQAGLTHIAAIVRDADAVTQAQLALIENVQREDLNPIDRAAAYRVLLDRLGMTQAQLASRLGEERSSIANFVRLLDLAPTVQQQVRNGKLSLGHAKLLAGVPDILEQQRLAELVVQQELSVRNLERLINEPAATSAPRQPSTSAHLADLERTMTQQLGLRVQLRRSGKGKGRVVIHYGSLEQFDDLVARLALHLGD
jgi:ParB family chromosome partitioning protein